MGVKVSRTIALLRKLQHIVPRHVLITICKSFICPYLDYGDILYYKAFNASFDQKIESIQELGLGSLQHRRWYQKLCYFRKIYMRSHLTICFNTH